MSHSLESFLSLDNIMMLSIGSKFPKFWIQSFWLIIRFWVRFKTGIGFGRSKTLYKFLILILWNLNILIEVLDCIIFQLIIIEGIYAFLAIFCIYLFWGNWKLRPSTWPFLWMNEWMTEWNVDNYKYITLIDNIVFNLIITVLNFLNYCLITVSNY